MPRVIGILLAIFVLQAFCEDIRLVKVGESWRYFKGTSEPGDWRETGFDDSGWLTGLSTFSGVQHLETTGLLDFGAGYRTVYFRKKFGISDLTNIGQLVLRIDYDDAFVAYVNGKEVARRGISTPLNEPPRFDALGQYHPRGATEHIDVSDAFPVLREGENVLAIQVHGSYTNDFTFVLAAELLNTFTRMPHIQNTTSNSVQIIYKTLAHTTSTVEYKVAGNANAQQISLSALSTNHVASLGNLMPDTLYEYRVSAPVNGVDVTTDWKTFRTFKVSGEVKFQLIGDSGTGSFAQHAIARRLESTPGDLLMHCGDVIYYNFNHYQADFRCFSTYSDLMRERPVFLAIGNHDGYIDPRPAIESFYLPTNNVTGTEHFYSFDHGDVHFTVLWVDLQAGASYTNGSPQYIWLENDLASTDKPWKFIFFHHTFRTSSYHYADDGNYNKIPDMDELQASIGVLASRYGVQIIFNGHDHDYERFAPLNGVVSVVTGGGGAGLYPMFKYLEGSVQFYPVHHLVDVVVTSEETVLRAIDINGSVFDTFHLRRSFPAGRSYKSELHTPFIERGIPSDSDGNIPGQSFNFIGEPIPSKAGAHTLAGRLFVNNDGDNIYLGIDEAGLNSAQDLYLFLQTPGLEGVEHLAQFGTGLSPGDEPVPGFDFVQKVAFSGFTPAIGIILGDETGDGPSRTLRRPLAATAVGQGAFYLREGTPAVPGQVLQQFNRSPQGLPLAYEQNASYVELAIPYESAGAVPGDQIKVALVAGLAPIDPETNTREIDSGGVAHAVNREGGKTTIEGVTVLLADILEMDALLLPNGTIRLSWYSIPGTKYALQTAAESPTGFTNSTLPEFPYTATGKVSSVTIPLSDTPTFFRLVALP